MIKEELEKEAEKSLDKRLGTYCYIMKQNCYRNYVDGYIDGAESREKQIQIDAEQIRALQKQNGELTDKIRELETRCNELFFQVNEMAEQIEKMKCCGNCENGELSAHEEPCLHCQRCFASEDVTDQENVKDNWEVIKEIKENG